MPENRPIYIDVFPACAGMNRRHMAHERRQGGVPRVRGDEPAMLAQVERYAECSPRARG